MSSLNCSEFDRLLATAVEDRLGEQAGLRTHADDCPSCAGKLAEHLLLARAVSEWKGAVPVVDLRKSVLSAMAAEPVTVVKTEPTTPVIADPKPRVTMAIIDSPVAKLTSREMIAALLVAAAVLVLLPLLAWKSDDGTATNINSTTIIKVDQPKTYSKVENIATDDRVDVDRLVAGLQSRVGGLSRNVTYAVSSLQIDLPGMDIDVMPDLQGEPDIAPKIPGEQRSWSQDLEPVGRDVRKAFGFLREAIPVSTTASGS